MKREHTISGLKFKTPFAVVCLLSAVTFPGPSASASSEVDRKFALESVGFLRSWDNVDGLFTDYVAAADKDFFSRQSRFVVQDLSRVDQTLVHSKLGYAKAVQDNDVLAQLARSTHSQTLIRTHVQKEGSQYRFEMEWLLSPKMVPLAVETMILKEPSDGQALGSTDVQGQIEAALEKMIAKIPFFGHVTGRDGSSITLNIGANSGLKKGDTVVLSTLDDVKVHPLLGVIVDWRLTKTGTVEVESVDDAISFCKVLEEEPNRQIARFQKVTQIIPGSERNTTQVINEEDERKKAALEMPKLGFASGGLTPGGFSRQFNGIDPSTSRTGGGTTFGAKVDGELWFTRDVFAELGYGYNFWTQGQHPVGGDTDTFTGGSSVSTVHIGMGYSYLVTGDFFGPKGWVKVGYRSTSYNLPSSNAESLQPISFKSLFVGIGGDLPVRNNWGALLNFDLGVVNGATEGGGGPNGSVSSASDVNFVIGGYYRFSNRLTFRVGLDVLANSADFGNGASLSQKVISISPAVLYYF